MKNLMMAALLGGVVAGGIIVLFSGRTSPSPVAASQPPSAFERVTSAHVLRCAYAAADPVLVIDPAGKHISGPFHDIVEEAAKRLNLKVQWVEEVSYGDINTGFATGRYDAFCSPLWASGNRSESTVFSRPVVYGPVGIWVRGDDNRFDGHPEMLNDPAYKVEITEGDATVSMANAMFPKAGRALMSQSQSIAEDIDQVTTGKADALFEDYLVIDRFLQTQPGSLKNASPDKPVLFNAVTMAFAQHEFALREMFDVALSDMERDGTTATIIKNDLGDKANMLFHRTEQYAPY